MIRRHQPWALEPKSVAVCVLRPPVRAEVGVPLATMTKRSPPGLGEDEVFQMRCGAGYAWGTLPGKLRESPTPSHSNEGGPKPSSRYSGNSEIDWPHPFRNLHSSKSGFS